MLTLLTTVFAALNSNLPKMLNSNKNNPNLSSTISISFSSKIMLKSCSFYENTVPQKNGAEIEKQIFLPEKYKNLKANHNAVLRFEPQSMSKYCQIRVTSADNRIFTTPWYYLTNKKKWTSAEEGVAMANSAMHQDDEVDKETDYTMWFVIGIIVFIIIIFIFVIIKMCYGI